MMIDQTNFLSEVAQRLDHVLQWDAAAQWSDLPVLTSAARHLCLAPGAKRARPRLVHLFGLSVDASTDALADVAVAAEFIHGASLMHDDVIDEGSLRRGRPTVNARWDNLTAVLTGDLLLSEAISGLSRWPRPITNEALQVVAAMSRAAMLEAHVRGRTDTTAEQWRYIALGKTGTMFQWCGRAAGWLAEDPQALECFGKFGDQFGIAFQMADDLKDLIGGDIGKDRFADIRNRNPSYPMIIAMSRSPGLKKDLETLWKQPTQTSEEISQLGMALIELGAAEDTLQQVGEEVNAAIDSLGPYKDRPGCAQIASWAMAMWRNFTLEAAV